MHRKSRKQLTTRFLHRSVLFSTSFSVGLALFFIFGTMQKFIDTTQSLILSVLSATALVTVILAVISITLELILFFRKKKKIYLSMLLITFFCLSTGVFFSVITHFIILLSLGL